MSSTQRKAMIRDIRHLLQGSKRDLIAAIATSLLAAGASLSLPLVINRIVTHVGDGITAQITTYALLACGLLSLAGIFGALQQFLLHRLGEDVVLNARHSLIQSLMRLPIREFDQRRTGDLVSRVSSDTTAIRFALSQGVVAGIGGVATMVGAVIALALLDPVLFGVTVGIASIFVVVTLVMAVAVRRASTSLQTSVGTMTAAVDRALTGIRTIRAGNMTRTEESRVLATAQGARDAGVKVARITSFLEPMSMLTLQASILAVLGVGGYRVASGDLSVADMVSFLMFVFMLVAPLGQIFSAFGTFGSALGAADRIREIRDLPGQDPVRAVPEADPASGPAAVTFEDVSFAHRDDVAAALDHVDFDVPAGNRVALVGPSGAGKSTTLDLLVRFYEPTGGRVLIDGRDIASMPADHARRNVAYVEQDAPALPGTIRDNLALIAPDATDEQCWDVLRALDLDRKVAGSPNGLKTVVGEHGVTLSGGERQRMAVGRALLAHPRLLLLDETTANLDARTETLVRDAVTRLSAETTSIVVAHRLATVVDADTILVLDRGRIVAAGTHDELLVSCSLYAELARSQLLTS